MLNFKQSLSISLEIGAQRELKLEEQPSRKEKRVKNRSLLLRRISIKKVRRKSQIADG